MSKFNTFQLNNLKIGTGLAAEIPSSSSELKAFVVIGVYVMAPSGHATLPSKILNREQDLHFWFRKYEIHTSYIGVNLDLPDELMLHAIYLKDIQSIEALEDEVGKYLQDFSLLKTLWSFDPPLPF